MTTPWQQRLQLVLAGNNRHRKTDFPLLASLHDTVDAPTNQRTLLPSLANMTAIVSNSDGQNSIQHVSLLVRRRRANGMTVLNGISSHHDNERSHGHMTTIEREKLAQLRQELSKPRAKRPIQRRYQTVDVKRNTAIQSLVNRSSRSTSFHTDKSRGYHTGRAVHGADIKDRKRERHECTDDKLRIKRQLPKVRHTKKSTGRNEVNIQRAAAASLASGNTNLCQAHIGQRRYDITNEKTCNDINYIDKSTFMKSKATIIETNDETIHHSSQLRVEIAKQKHAKKTLRYDVKGAKDVLSEKRAKYTLDIKVQTKKAKKKRPSKVPINEASTIRTKGLGIPEQTYIVLPGPGSKDILPIKERNDTYIRISREHVSASFRNETNDGCNCEGPDVMCDQTDTDKTCQGDRHTVSDKTTNIYATDNEQRPISSKRSASSTGSSSAKEISRASLLHNECSTEPTWSGSKSGSFSSRHRPLTTCILDPQTNAIKDHKNIFSDKEDELPRSSTKSKTCSPNSDRFSIDIRSVGQGDEIASHSKTRNDQTNITLQEICTSAQSTNDNTHPDIKANDITMELVDPSSHSRCTTSDSRHEKEWSGDAMSNTTSNEGNHSRNRQSASISNVNGAHSSSQITKAEKVPNNKTFDPSFRTIPPYACNSDIHVDEDHNKATHACVQQTRLEGGSRSTSPSITRRSAMSSVTIHTRGSSLSSTSASHLPKHNDHIQEHKNQMEPTSPGIDNDSHQATRMDIFVLQVSKMNGDVSVTDTSKVRRTKSPASASAITDTTRSMKSRSSSQPGPMSCSVFSRQNSPEESACRIQSDSLGSAIPNDCNADSSANGSGQHTNQVAYADGSIARTTNCNRNQSNCSSLTKTPTADLLNDQSVEFRTPVNDKDRVPNKSKDVESSNDGKFSSVDEVSHYLEQDQNADNTNVFRNSRNTESSREIITEKIIPETPYAVNNPHNTSYFVVPEPQGTFPEHGTHRGSSTYDSGNEVSYTSTDSQSLVCPKSRENKGNSNTVSMPGYIASQEDDGDYSESQRRAVKDDTFTVPCSAIERALSPVNATSLSLFSVNTYTHKTRQDSRSTGQVSTSRAIGRNSISVPQTALSDNTTPRRSPTSGCYDRDALAMADTCCENENSVQRRNSSTSFLNVAYNASHSKQCDQREKSNQSPRASIAETDTFGALSSGTPITQNSTSHASSNSDKSDSARNEYMSIQGYEANHLGDNSNLVCSPESRSVSRTTEVRNLVSLITHDHEAISNESLFAPEEDGNDKIPDFTPSTDKDRERPATLSRTSSAVTNKSVILDHASCVSLPYSARSNVSLRSCESVPSESNPPPPYWRSRTTMCKSRFSVATSSSAQSGRRKHTANTSGNSKDVPTRTTTPYTYLTTYPFQNIFN